MSTLLMPVPDLAPAAAAAPSSEPTGSARPGDAAGPGPVLALDLGGTHVRTAVVDASGRVYARRHGPSPVADGADAVVKVCADALRASLDEHLAAGGVGPQALGVSAPGPLRTDTGVLIDPPNLGPTFDGFPLAERLERAVGLPTRVERDTHVAALAEGRYGAGVGLTDFVYLTVSTGIGGGVVTGGRLMTGPQGMAGELGHMVVDFQGPVCGCGGRGHLERLASGTGIATSAQEALAAGRRAPILEDLVAARAPKPLGAVTVAQAEEAGDPLAIEIMDTARRAFAAAMVSIVDVFSPQRIIVGGGVAMGQGERLLGPARDAVAREAFRTQAAQVEIVPAVLGDDVCLVGTLPLVHTGSAVVA